jgi:hypothetical protein
MLWQQHLLPQLHASHTFCPSCMPHTPHTARGPHVGEILQPAGKALPGRCHMQVA